MQQHHLKSVDNGAKTGRSCKRLPTPTSPARQCRAAWIAERHHQAARCLREARLATTIWHCAIWKASSGIAQAQCRSLPPPGPRAFSRVKRRVAAAQRPCLAARSLFLTDNRTYAPKGCQVGTLQFCRGTAVIHGALSARLPAIRPGSPTVWTSGPHAGIPNLIDL